MNTHRLPDATSPPSQPSSVKEEGADAVRRVATAWLVVTVVFILTSLVSWPLSHQAIDWQPTLAFTQPWRAFSAAFVHYSPMHLAANLVGALLVGAFGWAAQVPRHMAMAWLLAWPLTQLGLLVQPSLLHYGGLSGVLHAGVMIVCLHLVFEGTSTQRRVGCATLLVVIAKVLLEAPWQGPLTHPAEWDIAVAPMAHACGAVVGVIAGVVAGVVSRVTPGSLERNTARRT
jgi:rhomboid family GlyGly-CTERM serine protease